MLNDRQLALYRYLLSRGDRWSGMTQILQAMGDHYPRSRRDHDSFARRMLTKDIQALNEAPEVEKIVSHGNRGIKLLTEQEAGSYIRNRYSEAFSQLRRTRRIEAKVKASGQTDLWDHLVNAFISERKNDTEVVQ